MDKRNQLHTFFFPLRTAFAELRGHLSLKSHEKTVKRPEAADLPIGRFVLRYGAGTGGVQEKRL